MIIFKNNNLGAKIVTDKNEENDNHFEENQDDNSLKDDKKNVRSKPNLRAACFLVLLTCLMFVIFICIFFIINTKEKNILLSNETGKRYYGFNIIQVKDKSYIFICDTKHLHLH